MYRWKPSKSQRKAFAIRMQTDPEYAAAYEERKLQKQLKRKAGSQFTYDSAGGRYVPHKYQNQTACEMLESGNLTPEQKDAARLVTSAYVCNEPVHHDYIHIVNEWERSRNAAAMTVND